MGNDSMTMIVYMDSTFKKFTSILDRLTLEMNACLVKINITEWMTKEKTTLVQKEPQRNGIQKL